MVLLQVQQRDEDDGPLEAQVAALQTRLDTELAGVGVSIVQVAAGLQRGFEDGLAALEIRLGNEVGRPVADAMEAASAAAEVGHS